MCIVNMYFSAELQIKRKMSVQYEPPKAGIEVGDKLD